MNRKILILLSTGLITFGACEETKTVEEGNTRKEHKETSSTSIFNKALLVGSWLDQSESKLHFSMLEDGTACSDNMVTLSYQRWRLDGAKLILTVKSIGNGSSSIGDDIYEIKILTDEKMVLQDGSVLWEFIKKK